MRREILRLAAFVVMFWNVENFFDPFDDPLKNDNEYTAQAVTHWTWGRFERKRDLIGKTIIASASATGDLPAIVGLAEVENRLTVRQIATKSPLAELGYGYIHRESPDQRGIDVAMLYRKDRFRPIVVDSLRISGFETRDILYVKGLVTGGISSASACGRYGDGSIGDGPGGEVGGGSIGGGLIRAGDTLHIFVNHWPSKRGGAAKSQPRRDSVRALLTAFCDSILTADPCCRIIAMGDFNDTEPEALPLHRCTPVPPAVFNSVSPSDFTSMLPASFTGIQPETADGGHPDGSQTIGGHPDNDHLAAGHPSTGSSQAGRPHTVAGTLKYRGRWEIIDHFFVSDALSGHIPGSCIPADTVSAETAGPVEGVEASDAQATADTQSAAAVADAESVKPASAARAVIFAPGFLLEADKSYLGVKPRRTYIGPRYNGGVSDHLPILLKISLCGPTSSLRQQPDGIPVAVQQRPDSNPAATSRSSGLLPEGAGECDEILH